MRLPKPNETDWDKIISKWTGYLIGFLALASFILSYEALWTVAIDSGINFWLAWLWPLALDFFVLVASLSILGSSLNSEPKKYAWTLVIVFTVLSIVFNAIHKGLPLETYNYYVLPYIPVAVYVLPPVAFVFSFHLGMAQVENALKKKPKVKPDDSLVELDKKIETIQMSTVNEDSEIKTESQPVTELDKANEVRQSKVDERRAALSEMVKEGLPETELARLLNVSVKTIQRDKTILGLNGNGHNGKG